MNFYMYYSLIVWTVYIYKDSKPTPHQGKNKSAKWEKNPNKLLILHYRNEKPANQNVKLENQQGKEYDSAANIEASRRQD